MLFDRCIKTAVLVSMVFIVSCAVKPIALKGNYSKEPHTIFSVNSFENVWDKLIDLFAQVGIGIKLIDKSSGLIVANSTTVGVTYEDKNENLADPTAWIVSSKIYEPGAKKYFYPKTASVEWNVRIKKADGGGTNINVNITAINSQTSVTQVGPIVAVPTVSLMSTQSYSTGVFEKKLSDYLK